MSQRISAFQATSSRPIIGTMRGLGRLLIRVALLTIDLLAIGSGFRLAYFIRFESSLSVLFAPVEPTLSFYTFLVFWLIPLWLAVFYLFRLYDFEILFGGTWEYAKVFNACSFGMMMVIVASFLYPDLIIARAWLLLSWFLITFSVMAGRMFFRRVIYYFRRRGRFMSPILIVGADEEGIAVAEQLSQSATSGVWLVGFVDDRWSEGQEVGSKFRILGDLQNLPNLIAQHDVHEIIISSSALSRQQLLDIFHQFGNSDDVTLRLSSGLFEIFTTGLQVREVGSVPLLRLNKFRLAGLEVLLKTAIDYSMTLVGLAFALPLFVLIAIAIKLESNGPILHRRQVLGVGNKTFPAFKFRSMHVNADEILKEILAKDEALRKEFEANYKLKDDPRVTRVGSFLRRTSLDELPQLINVLRGEMSLIGPRMITQEEHERYGKLKMNLLTVKPGITGLWQVSGRSDVSYEERVMLDMYYIRNYSLWMDIHILLQTVPKVFRGSGAY